MSEQQSPESEEQATAEKAPNVPTHPCPIFNNQEITEATCRETSAVPARNRGGCCKFFCDSPWRICIACALQGAVVSESTVVNHDTGRCAFHEQHGPNRRRDGHGSAEGGLAGPEPEPYVDPRPTTPQGQMGGRHTPAIPRPGDAERALPRVSVQRVRHVAAAAANLSCAPARTPKTATPSSPTCSEPALPEPMPVEENEFLQQVYSVWQADDAGETFTENASRHGASSPAWARQRLQLRDLDERLLPFLGSSLPQEALPMAVALALSAYPSWFQVLVAGEMLGAPLSANDAVEYIRYRALVNGLEGDT